MPQVYATALIMLPRNINIKRLKSKKYLIESKSLLRFDVMHQYLESSLAKTTANTIVNIITPK